MVFNPTLNNTSLISWRSVLLMEEAYTNPTQRVDLLHIGHHQPIKM